MEKDKYPFVEDKETKQRNRQNKAKNKLIFWFWQQNGSYQKEKELEAWIKLIKGVSCMLVYAV